MLYQLVYIYMYIHIYAIGWWCKDSWAAISLKTRVFVFTVCYTSCSIGVSRLMKGTKLDFSPLPGGDDPIWRGYFSGWNHQLENGSTNMKWNPFLESNLALFLGAPWHLSILVDWKNKNSIDADGTVFGESGTFIAHLGERSSRCSTFLV